ncbi:MAG: phosphohistidine phosphatase SixA [Phycisphaerae bacterium]|nr:MAG: phosphohistidine phosphatase SixA [Planctomycetia bacterium]RIK68694.1 MAG: phosphohistidine phosphatase SixA [Planctomycetota bacterium]GJQ25612.1 MAG: phosphohistidine phosphatase SixA [Phycisphaerae bacterium]
MKLILVRHGIATQRDAPPDLDDAARPLTPAGIRRFRRAAQGFARLQIAVDEVWTSPLLRAVQTAELLVQALARPCGMRTVSELEPGGSFDELLARLRAASTLTCVALVGHEPYLGDFATYLLTGSRFGAVRFKKGSMAAITVDSFEPPIRGQLQWLLAPKQLRLMARKRS